MSQSERDNEARRNAGKRFLGLLLMTAGGLLALLCGLCTFVLSANIIGGALHSSATTAQLSVLLFPLIIGGIPTALGVVLFMIGLSMFREGRKRLNHPERVFD